MVDDRTAGDAASLIASTRLYYDERADDYADESRPSDRKKRGLMTPDLERALVDELTPTGHVLELACGTGEFTGELVRHAETLTAVDGSARMLEIARRRVNDPSVRFVHADIFQWTPDRLYDAVFFGFWLSHVPPDAFGAFWDLVRECLGPGGRVAFADEDHRAAGHEATVTVIDDVPVARRTLSDGREFEIVKVFWRPEDLEERLRELGWGIAVRPVGETFLYGCGRVQTGEA